MHAPEAPAASYEAAAEKARLEAIASLQAITLRGEFTGEQKAEVGFRLAELYVEQARAEDARRMAACVDAGTGCDPAETPPGARWREKAVLVYRRALESAPGYARADEITLGLATALTELGRADEGQVELTRLVRTWPQSRSAPRAWLLLGEYWFDRDTPLKAMTAYQHAAADRSVDTWVFASYKLAWCYYNVGEYGTALDSLRTVLAATGKDAQLRDEALTDYVRFFADSGRDDLVADLRPFVSDSEMPKYQARAAEILVAQGKFDAAGGVYRRLLAQAPLSASAPDWQLALVQVLAKQGRMDDRLALLTRMADTYAPSGDWARANPGKDAAVRESLESETRRLALEAHALTKKSEDRNALPRAQAAYEAYFRAFPEGAHATEMHYAFGELLWQRHDFSAAYHEYVRVRDADPKGEHALFCAESAIFAAQEMEKRAPTAPLAGKDPVPLTEWEQKELAAIDAYLKLQAGGPKTVSLTYRSAYVLYQKNHLREASERFNVVIQADPKSPQAEQAANLLLDSFALVEDWEGLRDAAKRYSETPQLGSAAFRAEAHRVYENASYKVVEARFARDGDKAAAATAYLAWYREFPDSPNAELALNNASVYLHDAGKLRDAMATREELLTRFPRSKYRADQMAALAWEHESLAEFEPAATWYERFADTTPTHGAAGDALLSAAVFRASLGQWERSIADYRRYAGAVPTKAEGALTEIASLYEANGKPAEAAEAWKAVFERKDATVDAAMHARLRYGLLLGELGQGQRAAKAWNESLAWWTGVEGASAGAKADAGRMMLALAEPEYQAFAALRIDGPAGRKLGRAETDALLSRQLSAKVNALKALETRYGAIVSTGAAEPAVGALVQLGAAYENLSATLEQGYVPDYLTDDQRSDYVDGISTVVYAQREKAAAAYEAALNRSFELGLYDADTARAAERLAALRPDDHPPAFEARPTARFTAPAVFSPGIEQDE